MKMCTAMAEQPSRSPHVAGHVRKPTVALARSSPIARMVSPVRLFRRAKTCLTFDRADDFRPLAFAVRPLMGRLFGFLQWMQLRRVLPSSRSSFTAKRQIRFRAASPVARGFKGLPGSQGYHSLKYRLQRLKKVNKSKESQSCEGSRMLHGCICAGADFDSNLQDRQ